MHPIKIGQKRSNGENFIRQLIFNSTTFYVVLYIKCIYFISICMTPFMISQLSSILEQKNPQNVRELFKVNSNT